MVIRIASDVLPVFRVIIKALAPIVKIGRSRQVPASGPFFYLTGSIVVKLPRCFRTGQKGRITVFVCGRHCHQIIFLIYNTGFSIRMHQICFCKQSIYSALQHGISLRISIGIIPVTLSCLQIHIPFVDMNFSFGPVIIDPPPVIFTILSAAMAVAVCIPHSGLLTAAWRMQSTVISIREQIFTACVPVLRSG